MWHVAAPQTPTLTLSFTLTLTLSLAHAQGRLRPDAAPQPVVGRSLSPPLAVSGVFLPSPRPGAGTSLNTPLASSPTAVAVWCRYCSDKHLVIKE